MKAEVAIIIVTYNSLGQIESCLESIFFQRKKIVQQVILVDNNSIDNTAEIVRCKFPKVELIISKKNLGFAAGVNLGVNHADAEFIILLNPDTIILNHTVDVIVDFAKKNPAQGLYGGRTFKLDGSLEPSSCWGRPTLWSMIMFAVGLTVIFPRNRWLDPESLGPWKRDSVKEVGVITGCFLLVPKLIWDQLGGLDERYFMYGEDVDFSIRAWNSGWRPVICPSAKLVHEVGKSSENSIDKTLLLYLGKVSLIKIHWNGLEKWLGLFLLVTGVGIRAVFFGILNLFRCNNGIMQWQTLWLKRNIWIKGYKI